MLGRFSMKTGFAIHAYSAMPDHLHFLSIGLLHSSNLLEFVGSFKQHTGFHYEKRKRRHLWQFKFYDHILRRADAIDKVASYIWMNPVRKGICADPMAYAFSGSFVLKWKATVVHSSNWSPPWRHPAKGAALKRGATLGPTP
jgi:hypothetical protein